MCTMTIHKCSFMHRRYRTTWILYSIELLMLLLMSLLLLRIVFLLVNVLLWFRGAFNEQCFALNQRLFWLNTLPRLPSTSNTFLFVIKNHPSIGIDRVLDRVLDLVLNRYVVITICCIIWFCTFSSSCRSFFYYPSFVSRPPLICLSILVLPRRWYAYSPSCHEVMSQ